MEQAIIANVVVDYCPRCYGLWFEEDELQFAKDEKDRSFRWLDFDLWRDETKFRISPAQKFCPKDRMPLYETAYGDSQIKIDVCNLCYGVWLDRGEFKELIAYIKEKAEHEVLYRYLKNVVAEIWEVFSGPEMLKEEVLDVLAIVKLLRYKFLAQHPTLSKILTSLPR